MKLGSELLHAKRLTRVFTIFVVVDISAKNYWSCVATIACINLNPSSLSPADIEFRQLIAKG